MADFSPEHDLFRQSLRDLLKAEVLPHIDRWEEEGAIPPAIFRRFGEMGYLGLFQPEAYGGLDLDFWYTVILLEELSRLNSGGFGAAIGAHAYLAMTHLKAAANEAQKQVYLVPSIRGEKIGCLALTEPFGGSDLQAIRTTAIRDNDVYRVNGSKTFITNGVQADFIIAAVKTDPQSPNLSMLIIDVESPGLQARKLDKLGWRASDTAELAFDDVAVPADHLLGIEGHGFYYIMQHFVLERLTMAVGAVAASGHALEQTLQYMSERQAFGRSLNRFQELRHRIAQLCAEVARDRAFVYHVCRSFHHGRYMVKEACMAKLLTTQGCDRVATECLQFFGGYGYMEDYPMARFFRDARLGQIGGGTSEIMCEIIAKMIIDGQDYRPALGK